MTLAPGRKKKKGQSNEKSNESLVRTVFASKDMIKL